MPYLLTSNNMLAESTMYAKNIQALRIALGMILGSALPLECIDLINSFKIKNNCIEVRAHSQLALTKDRFYAEYDGRIDVHALPYTVATIPFILNAAPLVWLSGQHFEIDAMDEDLFYALEKIQLVFRLFFPHSSWHGTITPKTLVKIQHDQATQRVGVLFSHGLDAVHTSMSHLDQDQVLITVWGSDVMPTKTTLWHHVLEQCQQYAQSYGYDHHWVRSNFAFFYNPHAITRLYPTMTNWFGQAMQACAYLGVAAPIAYSTGCSSLLIASTRTQEYPYPYGTHPALDNLIAFAGINVFHDGAEVDRVQKIEKIQELCTQHTLAKPLLRVCWGKDVSGGNCGECEKCVRTITELITVGQDPQDYGFAVSLEQTLPRIRSQLAQLTTVAGLSWHWSCIAKKALNTLANHDEPTPPDETIKQIFTTVAAFKAALSAKSAGYNDNRKKLYAFLWQEGMQRTLSLETLSNLTQQYPPQFLPNADQRTRSSYTRAKSRATKRGS